MSDNDEYELLPKQEIEYLKKEVERLKKNPLGDLEEGESLLDSINNLNKNINKLIDLFTKVQSDMLDDYSKGKVTDDIRAIKEQNEQIAEGIITVADIVKDKTLQEPPLKQEPRMPMPGSMPRSNMPPPMPEPFPENLPPLPSGPGPDFGAPTGAPPIPPPPRKKRGLFSRK